MRELIEELWARSGEQAPAESRLTPMALTMRPTLRWFWALHFPSKPESLRTDNRAATLEEAKAEFQKEGLGEAGGGTVTRLEQFRICW